jgi:hypothetical protein
MTRAVYEAANRTNSRTGSLFQMFVHRDGATQPHSCRAHLTTAIACGLILRMAIVCVSFQSIAHGTQDHGSFGAEMGWVARSIATGQGFSSPFLPHTGPTALMPPLFPCLLAGVFRLFGLYTVRAAFAILTLNSLFSALTCLPIYFCLKWIAGERPALLASWLGRSILFRYISLQPRCGTTR